MLITSQVIKESEIQFGTSGARGLVEQFTPHVCEAFAHAFMATVEANFEFGKVAVAIDNRPFNLGLFNTFLDIITLLCLYLI